MSTVDVVVPCYNYARFLPRCVGSILTQQGVDVRVLIIDDASSDDTPLVGQRLSCLDRLVEFRRHEVNRGHIATYNEGLMQWASADYSLLLSADDALTPGALARATQLMDRHCDVGMTYGMALIISDESGLDVPATEAPEEYQRLSGSQFLQRCCAFGNPVPTPTAVVRTKLQQQLGGYRADFPHSGDMEMWMRFAVHSSIGVLRAVQGYYGWHSGNMSSRYYGELLSDQRERFRACNAVLGQWGAHFSQCSLWLDAMSRRVGEEAFWLANKAFDSGDVDGCVACLQFAEDHYRKLHHTSMWWKLQAKKALGHALWRKITPAINYVRSIGKIPSMSPEILSRYQQGQINGWWPGAAENH